MFRSCWWKIAAIPGRGSSKANASGIVPAASRFKNNSGVFATRATRKSTCFPVILYSATIAMTRPMDLTHPISGSCATQTHSNLHFANCSLRKTSKASFANELRANRSAACSTRGAFRAPTGSTMSISLCVSSKAPLLDRHNARIPDAQIAPKACT